MKSNQASPSDAATIKGGIAIAVIACVAIAAWTFYRTPIELSKDHYAMTLALYRVCNQRSVEGLDQIDVLLAADASSAGGEPEMVIAIESIIAAARKDQWRQAAVDCRRLLDDQVKR